MLSIYISKLEKSNDYVKLFNNLALTHSHIREESGTHSLNFKYRKNDTTLILINGFELVSPKTGESFLDFFKKNNSNASPDAGKTEIDWLASILLRIIKKIDKNLASDLSIEKKANLFIHWGGAGRKDASARLRSAAKKFDFPFRIMDFSALDRDEYDKLVNGDLTDILEAEKSLIAKSEEFNRKIYELMETILIKSSDNYLKSLKENKPEPFTIADREIYRETKWLLQELKVDLQKSDFVENSTTKEKIEAFYRDKDKFESVIHLHDEPQVEILDIRKFRAVINEFLALLPYDIYPKES